MVDSTIDTLRNWHEKAHRRIIDATASLSDGELTWQPQPDELPVAWHLWHIARFADITQSGFHDAEQIWHRDGIAARWGFIPGQLGLLDGGTDMDQQYSAALPWPVGAELRSYAESAIEAAIGSTGAVTETNFNQRVPRIPDVPGVLLTYGDVLTRFVWHPGCHLGAIEMLIGARLREPALQ